MFEDRRGVFGRSQQARFAKSLPPDTLNHGLRWPPRNDYPDLWRLGWQFETLIAWLEMVIGWFRQFRHVKDA